MKTPLNANAAAGHTMWTRASETIGHQGMYNGNILTLKRRDDKAAVMDDFNYSYYANTNRLLKHKTAGGTYEYDAIGNLVKDNNENLSIAWTPSGKVRSVVKPDTTIYFRYDAMGNRIAKIVSTPTKSDTTAYVRDASGNVMTIYSNRTAAEVPIYGSSRIGEYMGKEKEGYQTFNLRKYELTNHLGNVLAVISDKVNLYGHGNRLDSARATMVSASDYYPGGMLMSGRVLNDSSYRYGYNKGSEKDDEIAGNANYFTTLFREGDTRLLTWWGRDPKPRADQSPYSYMDGNPIKNNDPDGDCPTCPPPQVNVGIGLTLGTHTNGISLNASISQQVGNWNVSAGFGAAGYSSFANTGKGGLELRGSFQGGFNDGKNSVSLGTNFFKGLGGMSEFSQRTGILNIGIGKFTASYENDGMPFAFGQKGLKAWAGDGDDKFRTAAVRLGFGEFSAGFNLFTGSRTNYDRDKDKVSNKEEGQFGERMPNGFVNEAGTPYRMGAAFLGYGGIQLGIDSDRWIRHPIQDNFAHNMPGTRQPGFRSLSNAIKPFGQISTMLQGVAPRFTLYNH